MPLIRGHSARARKSNIAHLRRKGYPEKQAVAMAYRIGRQSRSEVDDELGNILSEDFWISGDDALDALDLVKKSAENFDRDMRTAAPTGKIPAVDQAEWAKWKRQFDEYYKSVSSSFLNWRLLNATGILYEAERMATDISIWTERFRYYTGTNPSTVPPVRTHAGDTASTLPVILTIVGTIGVIGFAHQLYLRFVK